METSYFDIKGGNIGIEHIDEAKREIYFDDELKVNEIPSEILDEIQQILSDLTTPIYGIPCKNNYNLCQNGFKHFVKFPSCPPFANLKPSFRAVANRNRSRLHLFEDFCADFEITPSKKFRKLFLDNASVMLVNLFLNKIGVTDPNFYNKYYKNAILLSLLEQKLCCISSKPMTVGGFQFKAMKLWYSHAIEPNTKVCPH